MTHTELQDKLFDWHDGQLAVAEANDVALHVKGCPDCQAHLEAWRRTARLVIAPFELKPSLSFTQDVMRKVRQSTSEETVRLPWFSRWAWPALALSFGSFAAVLFYVGQPSAFSTEGLFIIDAPVTTTEWASALAKDDVLLASVAEKP